MNNTTTHTDATINAAQAVLHANGLTVRDPDSRLRFLGIVGYTAVVDTYSDMYNILDANGRIIFAANGDLDDAIVCLAGYVS